MPLRPRPKPKPQGPWHWHASTPTVLYLNDLEDIWTLLQSLDAPVRAETDQFLDIEGLDDLRALHGKPAKWMRISVGKAEPLVSVELGHGHTQFTIHSVSHTHVGVLEQFKHIVWRHWRQFAWASFGPIAALLLWLIAVVQVARGLLMLDGLTIVTGLLLGNRGGCLCHGRMGQARALGDAADGSLRGAFAVLSRPQSRRNHPWHRVRAYRLGNRPVDAPSDQVVPTVIAW